MKEMRSKSRHRSLVIPMAIIGIAFYCAFGCKRAADDPLDSKWKLITEEPLENAPILQQAMDSPCVWKVVRDGSKVRITLQTANSFEDEQPHVARLTTDAGMLIGTDNGEWGGGLLLTPANGSPSKRLLAENVLQLSPVKSGVLVFTGLLHLDVDRGAVWLYSNSGGHDWSIKKLFDLVGRPAAIYNENGDILLVTHNDISRVDQALNLKEVASIPLSEVHPNSISEDGQGRIYIGMDAFVVRLIPTKSGYAHEWFTRPECLR